MTHSLLVIDDFHPDPAALRASVVNSEFKTEKYADGAIYTGISHHQDPLIPELISAAFGGVPVIPRISVFRVSYENEVPHNFVHSDGICSRWAGLLYLNTPEQCRAHPSGTAFFRHQGLDIDAMPEDPELARLGLDPAAVRRKIEADWLDSAPWAMSGFVGMKWNRFVSYPTSRFHTRYPHEAFGKTPDDGRLILACFFDLGVDSVSPSNNG